MISEHRNNASRNIQCAVVTISDTRTRQTDKSGQKIIKLLTEADHLVPLYKIIPDDRELIRMTVEKAIYSDKIDAVILNGGTGISYRDVTIESIEPLFDKQIPGFGELFRHLSYQYDIGTASILSRAACGVANNCLVFSIPGSTGAVTLAMERLILPEIGHMVKEVNKDIHK
ncbi:MogA/MoaB family molybdenum cofactor biosynthesis protein [Oceanobacillus halophilus]|uniref:Molybdenum cofactor biosynthesis protein B n=1 Tax=Oceanobacillus halophilus TaxID=930130 RepID=A0A495ACB8_9BACI|nr:MogA/MoaB family molybdenum cofactor biosynthesis protein [Oceanobacillus halophilus]RKQ37244.1 MogA/MoaB family molybdenum cofactor biosynthesis protein [Oceanobacillus halophilus]